MNELLQHIGNFGFPIVISLYLLMRIEAKLEELTQSINKLSENILKIKA